MRFASSWTAGILVGTLILTAPGCGRSDFKELFGESVSSTVLVNCHSESGLDVIALRMERLPRDVAARLGSNHLALAKLPAEGMFPSKGLVRRAWTSGPLGEEAAKVLDLGLQGAAGSQGGECKGVPPSDLSDVVMQALAKKGTLYAYQYRPINGAVAAEALEFWLLDVESGVLYSLVNFS